jgi:hypothetical protein
MRALPAGKAAHSEHPFRKRVVVLKKCIDGEVFMHFFDGDIMPTLGIAGVGDDSRLRRKSVWDCELRN